MVELRIRVVAPASVVLQLLVVAHVNPHWLLTGQGEKYDHRSAEQTKAGHGVYHERLNGSDADP